MWGLDELRKQLGPEFAYGPGHWFCVSHDDVHRRDGYRFSQKTAGTGRRVVLATIAGPNATLFARSASRQSPFQHPAHDHGTVTRCKLDQKGWIDLRLPVSVPADVLDDTTYSCEEPPDSVLIAALDKAVAL